MAEPRPAPLFVADAAALDFLNSIASPKGSPVEWLDSGEGLLDWLQRAHLFKPEALGEIRRAAVPGELDAVAAQARALREWFRGFVVEHKGKPLRGDALKDLTPLNRILERDLEYGQIVKRERGQDSQAASGLMWRRITHWQTPDALLFPVARSMGELISQEDFSHVRACEGPSCTLLFLDRTHGRARRWCSMSACGNRAKQAAHRDRERGIGR
jgi:predicted RNA-binding Zn ribbon-like protein